MERKVWRGSLQQPSSVCVSQSVSLRDGQLSLSTTAKTLRSRIQKQSLHLSTAHPKYATRVFLTFSKINQQYQLHFCYLK